MTRVATVLPVHRLGAAWDRLIAQAAAEDTPVDTTAILPALGRRLTRIDPPREFVVLQQAPVVR